MTKYVVAVSGGVDSVVLLDMLAQRDESLVVAHFDHGIRPDSHEDTVFVRSLAERYDLPFETDQARLGAAASEEAARRKRYDFLRRIARKYGARLATAHHADDVVETVLLNLIRGTGWRGVAALRETPEVARPLLHYHKQELLAYAHSHHLPWREDSTNEQTHYLRNYIRHNIVPRLGEPFVDAFIELHDAQVALYHDITEVAQHIFALQPDESLPRYPFVMLEESVALELLYIAIQNHDKKTPTRPRLQRALLAIKTARPHTQHQLGDSVSLRFARERFTIQ